MRHVPIVWRCIEGAVAWLAVNSAFADTYVPAKWTQFITVAGQAEPIPAQWLQDAEARIAHSLKLPDAVPKPVPYAFEQPLHERLWFNAHRNLPLISAREKAHA